MTVRILALAFPRTGMCRVYVGNLSEESQWAGNTQWGTGQQQGTEGSEHLLYLKGIVGDSKSEDSGNSWKTNDF